MLSFNLHHLLQADSAAVFLHDEQQGALRTHIPSLFGVPGDMNDPLARLVDALLQLGLGEGAAAAVRGSSVARSSASRWPR